MTLLISFSGLPSALGFLISGVSHSSALRLLYFSVDSYFLDHLIMVHVIAYYLYAEDFTSYIYGQ